MSGCYTETEEEEGRLLEKNEMVGSNRVFKLWTNYKCFCFSLQETVVLIIY